MADTPLHPRAKAVLDYWLGDAWATAPSTYLPTAQIGLWFKGSPEIDRDIVEKFSGDLEALLAGQYDSWAAGPPAETVAGILLGDQLARNAFRGTARMYTGDVRALAWSKALVAGDRYKQLLPVQRVWAVMPFMHSEELADQEDCVRLFEELAADCGALGEAGAPLRGMAEQNIKYAILHRDVVQQWGRFPHRNAILGRPSTAEEEAGMLAGSIPKF